MKNRDPVCWCCARAVRFAFTVNGADAYHQCALWREMGICDYQPARAEDDSDG